ncbi:NAD-glutamate dehydrogenase [Aquibium oceanicum]|uniref:NAD-glutamate dehydrogenase n=1 Tax=Aquibium oceanicum TaxID=1670800 RepID=A0A1L3SZT7_9HYPH|nr:NAD-glutamate dehydrogenase [Aquibium oceanicum]APH74805.1 NAD-glutamate dehydrogenase [Aquibium oceanicum]
MGEAGTIDGFAGLLFSRASREDVSAYDPAMLKRAAELARKAVERHHKGESIVAIEQQSGVERADRPVTVITVVNDNMPFLFDSIMGEIGDGGVAPLLVTHPVIYVTHDSQGVRSIEGEADARADSDRLSVIHVHVSPMSEAQAQDLETRIGRVLTQVRAAVRDWKPMLARLEHTISDYRYMPVPLDRGAVTEAVAFLEWLRDDNFTFLGMRDYSYTDQGESGTLERTDQRGLGILSDPNLLVLRGNTQTSVTTPEILEFLNGPEPLIVTKANARSLVHRRAYLDYVGAKTFDSDGKLTGELRIVGLFTSTAYTRSILKIPYLRSKAEAVIAASGFDKNDHSGKALINVLESYPRDELFQMDTDLLRQHAMTVLALGERPRVRVLLRVDQFDRFVSIIVFVPRDRYDSRVRAEIGEYLKNIYEGRLSAYYPAFPEGSLARVHFIIGRSGGKTPQIPAATIEAEIRNIVRTWDDVLREAAVETGADARFAAIAQRFPDTYRNSFTPLEALTDAGRIWALSAANPIAIDFYRHADQPPEQVALKIFHHGAAVSLSQRVPLLENMGFRVISERTFEIGAGDGGKVFIHDMELESAYAKPVNLSTDGALFEDVFLAVWNRTADNDGYNGLVQTAGLRSREIIILRAYGRYLQQAGIPQSQDFIAAVLNRYPEIAADLFRLFTVRFDPSVPHGTSAHDQQEIAGRIEAALDDVPVLDEDTIIRRILNLIQSTLRTNSFKPPETGKTPSLAFKLDSRQLAGLPDPKPWREIFVYGPEVEGVHLRFGPVARGGLRWSDRAQDYRTEVLGLVKAQQVKNAVIVPVGAKGGFFPKQLPQGGTRDEVFQAGKAAYVNFVSSLLSITDNLKGDGVVPPEGVVRHDGDDPYFVVAADKGTATFSDTANEISQAHDFWLDDAFASGGSAGYDHKKMGITARGAWEAVKRHFREMNRDIQTEPFTVVGVGDMSGDVFGNGMLLSKEIRLIAAFDHRDIFIDPDPDPAASFAERERMFALPRSSWQDYDRSTISAGGGIFPRSQKAITLSQAAASAIGMTKTVASPTEIMNAILKAPADLLWFGGIGTYVRATSESNPEVGDRANDAIRVTAPEIGAKVVGEGANLGMTQRARIEYGLHGGRCNSDAIDNSGGVNSSDVEVNIKIALAAAMRSGKLTRPDRNAFLAEMTGEVGDLVLRNNYDQTLAISLSQLRGMADLPHQQRFMAALEASGDLDRIVETLPSDAALADRAARGEPLTRAEIGVLLAYAKIVLFTDIVESDLPDEKYFDEDLLSYFPDRMAQEYRPEIEGHRLRREIIATQLANDVINRGGPSFVNRLQDVTACPASEVVAAFSVVRDGFELPALFAEIDALDTKVDGMAQLGFYQSVVRLIYAASYWDLKNADRDVPVSGRIDELHRARRALEPRLAEMLPAFLKERLDERQTRFVEAGAPSGLAGKLAFLHVAELIPDIDLVASHAAADLIAAAGIYLRISEAFRIGRIEEAARAVVPADYYDGLALSRANDMIGAARRGMAVAVLSGYGNEEDPVAAWIEAGGQRLARARDRLQALTEGGDISVSRLTVAAGIMADLAG